MTKRVVWIEDDVGIIRSLIRPLERIGYQFTFLQSVGEALGALDLLQQADLILLDMIFPFTSEPIKDRDYPGIELLKALRINHDIDTPILILSVVSNRDVLDQAEELGIEGVLTKPIKPSVLKERVEDIIPIS